MAIDFTAAAEADLIQIYLDSAAQFGRAQAERYIAGLRQAFAFIEHSPLAVRERIEFDPPVRVHPHRSHLIVFRSEADRVVVLRIRHGREDWMSDPAGA